MLTVNRQGVTILLDHEGLSEVPYVFRPALKGQMYEQAFLDHIASLALPGVYLDIGAHLGTHTLWFALACPSTHVHAFEPVGRYAAVLRRNVQVNGLEQKVTVHQVGLSDQDGRASNLMSVEHQMGFQPDPAPVSEEFDVKRLDQVIRKRVALMKLDVEGMEAAVLRGARRILSRHRPAVFAEARTGQERDTIADVLAPLGYAATGRVFNASPTYEFTATPRTGRLLRLRRG